MRRTARPFPISGPVISNSGERAGFSFSLYPLIRMHMRSCMDGYILGKYRQSGTSYSIGRRSAISADRDQAATGPPLLNCTSSSFFMLLAGIFLPKPLCVPLKVMLVCASVNERTDGGEDSLLDALVTLDTKSLLESLGDLGRDLSEDGDLSLDDLLLAAVLHVSRDSLDEALLLLV